MPTHARGKVCLLSEAEASALEREDLTPDCRAHLHCSRKEAHAWTSDDYGPEKRTRIGTYRARAQARWVGIGGRYLVLEAVRRWMAYRGVMQLLPFATPIGTNRMPARSNGKPECMVMPSKSQDILAKRATEGINLS